MELPDTLKELLATVTQTDERCEIHQVYKQQYKDSAPFCIQCTQARIQKENIERVNAAVKNDRERARHYLRYNSLLDDETLTAATFDTYQTTTDGERRTKQFAQDVADRYEAGQVFNTLMVGDAGTGKSHLAMAILQQVNSGTDPRACAFAGTGEILRKIRNGFDNKQSGDTEEAVIARFAKPELLVLDDLGSETGGIGTAKQASDFTQNVLYSLMNRRQGKSTIITTNLNGQQLKDMYDAKLLSRLLRGTKGNILKFQDIPDKRINLEF